MARCVVGRRLPAAWAAATSSAWSGWRARRRSRCGCAPGHRSATGVSPVTLWVDRHAAPHVTIARACASTCADLWARRGGGAASAWRQSPPRCAPARGLRVVGTSIAQGNPLPSPGEARRRVQHQVACPKPYSSPRQRRRRAPRFHAASSRRWPRPTGSARPRQGTRSAHRALERAQQLIALRVSVPRPRAPSAAAAASPVAERKARSAARRSSSRCIARWRSRTRAAPTPAS